MKIHVEDCAALVEVKYELFECFIVCQGFTDVRIINEEQWRANRGQRGL